MSTSTDVKIKPLGDRVVVEVIDEAEVTTGGIFIPDSAREKSQKGRIVAVGPGKLLEKGDREEMDVKIGEIVLFVKYGGTDIKIGSKEYKILSARDLLGVIE